MKQHVSYESLRCHGWKKAGRIWLWRYAEKNRNFPGWHLSADKKGRESLITLIEAIGVDGSGATRSIALDPKDARVLSIPGRRVAKVVVPSAWRITVVGPDDTAWRFPETEEFAELMVGSGWLDLLAAGFADIQNPIGDYAIGIQGAGTSKLWFW